MFDERLIRAINRGNCFALVGSGPSAEMGYPSWEKLAVATYHELTKRSMVKDPQSYDRYIQHKQYPELFQLAERECGNRSELIRIIKQLLKPNSAGTSFIYDFLVNWPFSCYLTTNYDDELQQSLRERGY